MKWIMAFILVATLMWVGRSENSALAQQPKSEMSLSFVSDVPVGTAIQIVATLNDPAGNPIPYARIDFSATTEFLRVVESMDIESATTDILGKATFIMVPRVEGERPFTASFAGNDVFGPISVTKSLIVLTGPQQYLELSPVRVPGANKWMATAILVVVWGILGSSLVRVIFIARIGARIEESQRG
ncbi:MAG: hypothetical protein HQ478_12900 [Chloroflexi bacterium]|nr:hypothetical protein [Chloroflexota bacterium]